MNAVKSTFRSLFTRHLFITNVVSCGGLLAIGDCIVQTVERVDNKKKTGLEAPFDLKRTGRMFTIGLILGPFNHHWYRLLDKFVTGEGLKMVCKKIAADQAVAGPFFCTSFLVGSCMLEGTSIQECGREWKNKFLTIYMADWCVWPPAQFINFYFLPNHMRVVYVSLVTLCWNAFLSFMKHRDQHLDSIEVSKSSKDEPAST